MKIYEIIAESQQLNEVGGSIFVSMLEKVGAAKAFGWLANAFAKSPKEQAIEGFADHIAQAMRSGVSGDEAAKALKAAGVADDVIAAALKKAQAIVGKETIVAGGSAAAKAFGKGYQAISGGLTLWGVADPIIQCAEGINRAYDEQAKGNPEYQGIGLRAAIQVEINKCVGKLMALGIGRGVIRAGMSMPKNLFGAFYNGPMLDKAFNGMTSVAQTAFTAWLVSPQGQKALSNWILGSSFLGSAFREVRDYIGGWAMTGYKEIESKITGQPVNDDDWEKDVSAIDMTVPKSRWDAGTGARIR